MITQNFVQKNLAKLTSYSTLKFVILMVILIYPLKIAGTVITIKILANFLDQSSWLFNPRLVINTQPSLQTIMLSLFTGLIFAPVTETLMAQSLGSLIFVKKASISVILSSLIFTYLHWIKFLPIVGAFYVGLVLSFAYVVIQRENGTMQAIILTSLIHSLHNLIAILLQLFILK